MRLSRYFAALIAATAASFIAFANTVDIALARAVDYMLALWPTEAQPRMAGIEHQMQIEIGGTAVPADVLQSLRHEAGVSRRAAARNT